MSSRARAVIAKFVVATIGAGLLLGGVAAAQTPVLQSPSNGETVYTHTAQPDGSYSYSEVEFRYTCPGFNYSGQGWHPYQVQISGSPGGLASGGEFSATESQVSPGNCRALGNFLKPGTYYWRVYFDNRIGGISGPPAGEYVSPTWSFTLERTAETTIKNISPPDGATLYLPDGAREAPIGSVDLSFSCPRYTDSLGSGHPYFRYDVSLATDSAPGPSGFPATIHDISYLLGVVSPTNAQETECVTSNQFPLNLGTYYWQADTIDPDLPGVRNEGPVWSFTVVKRPPGLRPKTYMSKRDANAYARQMVSTRKRNARAVNTRCTRAGASQFKCSPSFKVGRRTFSGRLVVRHILRDGTVYWTGKWRRFFRVS